jgi:hypothetical protein
MGGVAFCTCGWQRPRDNVNRWIRQLPGAWTRKWRHLKLKPEYDGEVSRDNFVTHVRATLAYLEAYQRKLSSIPAKSGLHKIWPWNALKAQQRRVDTLQGDADTEGFALKRLAADERLERNTHHHCLAGELAVWRRQRTALDGEHCSIDHGDQLGTADRRPARAISGRAAAAISGPSRRQHCLRTPDLPSRIVHVDASISKAGSCHAMRRCMKRCYHTCAFSSLDPRL